MERVAEQLDDHVGSGKPTVHPHELLATRRDDLLSDRPREPELAEQIEETPFQPRVPALGELGSRHHGEQLVETGPAAPAQFHHSAVQEVVGRQAIANR